MDFEVVITARAAGDIDDHTTYIAQDSIDRARDWKMSLATKILSLSENPDRFDLIPEAEGMSHPYRSFNHYSHRVIFRIDSSSKKVFVVRVYHGARRPITNRDI